jgi:hypothetical protein
VRRKRQPGVTDSAAVIVSFEVRTFLLGIRRSDSVVTLARAHETPQFDSYADKARVSRGLVGVLGRSRGVVSHPPRNSEGQRYGAGARTLKPRYSLCAVI